MAKILIIDDNTSLAEIMTAALRTAGHSIKSCSSGKDGIRLVKEHSFDLVITDVVMPEQDGLEILMQLRKSHPQLQVILMSGDAPQNAPLYLKIGVKLGATRTLLKPFPIKTLFAAVDEALSASVSPPAAKA